MQVSPIPAGRRDLPPASSFGHQTAQHSTILPGSIDAPVRRVESHIKALFWVVYVLSMAIFLSACQPMAISVDFKESPFSYAIPPYASSHETTLEPSRITSTGDATVPSSIYLPTPEQVLPTGTVCQNDLQYMGDLTYPDKSIVSPGQQMFKQWKVRNSGTCDWGKDYRFRFLSGNNIAIKVEVALFPAHAGAEAVLVVEFTAPLTAGEYISNWQAIAPDGTPFGEILYIDVIVSR